MESLSENAMNPGQYTVFLSFICCTRETTLTLTSCSWFGHRGLGITHRRQRCDRADRHTLERLWGAGDDRRCWSSNLRSQRLGAQAKDRGVWNNSPWERWRSRSGLFKLIAWNSGPQTELELRFCRTEECLVDSRRVRVQSDVRPG